MLPLLCLFVALTRSFTVDVVGEFFDMWEDFELIHFGARRGRSFARAEAALGAQASRRRRLSATTITL